MKMNFKTVTKRFFKALAFMLCAAFILGSVSITSFAEESTEGELTSTVNASNVSGQITALDVDASAYREKDASSEVAMSFSAGDSVYIISEDDQWYEIFYKGENLYIPKEHVSEAAVAEAREEAEQLAKEVREEMAIQEKQDAAFSEAYVKYEKSQKNALIWKIVIAVLVVAILATSVIIAINNNKKSKGKNEEKTDDVIDLDKEEDNVQEEKEDE